MHDSSAVVPWVGWRCGVVLLHNDVHGAPCEGVNGVFTPPSWVMCGPLGIGMRGSGCCGVLGAVLGQIFRDLGMLLAHTEFTALVVHPIRLALASPPNERHEEGNLESHVRGRGGYRGVRACGGEATMLIHRSHLEPPPFMLGSASNEQT